MLKRKICLAVQGTLELEVMRHLSSANTEDSTSCPPHMVVLMQRSGMGGGGSRVGDPAADTSVLTPNLQHGLPFSSFVGLQAPLLQ